MRAVLFVLVLAQSTRADYVRGWRNDAAPAMRSAPLTSGAQDKPITNCIASVDDSKFEEWAQGTDSRPQIFFSFPNWKAGASASVVFTKSITGFDTCWNVDSRTPVRWQASASTLSFVLGPGSHTASLQQVGCIMHGKYEGATVSFRGQHCVQPPPPPPRAFVVCDDVQFYVISKWGSGWQARVTVEKWIARREIVLDFGGAGEIQVWDRRK